ncbi:MAG: S9 family peptidase [Bryobacterales bacterium]|nr:S9 family peptidase [Bryobacterales bacterium]
MRRLVFLLLAVSALSAQTQWTPELAMQVRSVGEALPSADGRWLVYAFSEAVMEDEVSEVRTQLGLASTDGSKRFQLTRGETSASSPQFSADSRFVYFRSKRGEGTGVWRIPVDGGEAEQALDWKGPLSSFAVSPDGSTLAFAAHPKNEAREKARKQKTDFVVLNEDEDNDSLWVVALDDGLAKAEPRELTDRALHVNELVWRPDSKRLAVVLQKSVLADRWIDAELREIDPAKGAAKTLGGDRRGAQSPHYSPDGQALAFVWTPRPAKWAGECTFAVLRNGAVQDLPDPEPDECGRGTNLLGWTADGEKLVFTAVDRTGSALRSMTLEGRQATIYAPKDGAISGYGGSTKLDAAGKRLGFALETASNPPEVHWLEIGAGEPAKLSDVNAGLASAPLGKTEVIRWTSPDGLEIEGLLTFPVGYQKGRKYPFVLNIHGGPMGVFQQTFIGARGLYPIAAFASEGFAVLRPNPRGSSGYGKKFRLANYDDWGGADYEDIMAGVDHVVAMGVADPDHMAVMGWSYGGFMTSWVIGHTARFRSAVAGAAVTDLWSFQGTTDIPSFLPDYFNGQPWERMDAYVKHSPMRYVDKVVTPTLVLHGDADARVPISQGYELYNALKGRGVETEMVVYPRQPHGPVEPKFVLDVMQRHLEWARKAR